MTSLAVVYGTTVLSCLAAPWLINRLTTKWTMVIAFSTFAGYFAASFYPQRELILPLSVLLGALAGPMWSAQATYVTTLALTYAQHRRIVFESEDVINQFMGVFFGFFRCSQIWGNLISTLILARNETDYGDGRGDDSAVVYSLGHGTNETLSAVATRAALTIDETSWIQEKITRTDGELLPSNATVLGEGNATTSGSSQFIAQSSFKQSASSAYTKLLSSVSSSTFSSSLIAESSQASPSSILTSPYHKRVSISHCGADTCNYGHLLTSTLDLNDSMNDLDIESDTHSVSDATKHLLLATYLGCVLLAAVIVVILLDQIHIGKTEADPEFSQSSLQLSLATARMLKDTKCLLLMPMVLFLGLEQGFMFSDFTKVGKSSR